MRQNLERKTSAASVLKVINSKNQDPLSLARQPQQPRLIDKERGRKKEKSSTGWGERDLGL